MFKFISAIFDRLNIIEETINSMAKSIITEKTRPRQQEVVLKGLTRALCVETLDPWKQNRVRFFHPILSDPKSKLFSLPFASPISSMGGFDDCGLNWVPPAGSVIMLLFESGNTDAAFYIGTSWHKDRGKDGQDITSIYNSVEYDKVSKTHRKGYIDGPNDESQVYPPWNTESYNSSDIYSTSNYTTDTNEQKKSTYPHIYGFKTPEKHMLKMVDGNAKCNRRWKRMELMSGCGNWMVFKDDHLHYGGQWSHPSCSPSGGGGSVETCFEYSDLQGKPLEKASSCEPDCECPRTQGEKCAPEQCSSILGGHSSTPCDPKTKYCDSQSGTNKFFKHKNECRPYSGPGTPQNNRCDLPQSGIQFLSISGHSWVMDDSVEEPRGIPAWERSLEKFDFGCNDKFLGRTYWKSATGHSILMSDVEELSKLRGKDNFIRIKSASGNKIELNDHTIGESDKGCPPNYAGEERGIHIESTSTHRIKMIDHMNLQCSTVRTEGGTPNPKATKAYVQIRSGYGLEMRYSDDSSQTQTQNQWIQITNPQCVNPDNDEGCNPRGPHFLRFQGRSKDQPGVIFLRAGGHSIRQTNDMDIVIVGDKDNNPSDKVTIISKQHIRVTHDKDYRYSGKEHVFFAENRILLLAGRDCPPPPKKKCKGPCIWGVIIARCPKKCPITQFLHWTEVSISERVFASGYHPCQVCSSEPCPTGCETLEPDPPQTSIDTGAGIIDVSTVRVET